MYCYHCGKKIDEHKIEKKQSSYSLDVEIKEDTEVSYICPRCGHLIHPGYSEGDIKELSRASHTLIQRANNSFAVGMCLNALGAILLIIAFLFYLLAKKPSKGFVLQVNCAEFYVFVVLLVFSVILLVFGVVKTVIGIRNKKHYSSLLKDLNNKTFVQ